MPSANVQVAKPATGDMDVFVNPMKPAITIVEHKIRNLEKRKTKLDQYRSEQASGKELNADQLTAVAKYDEVIQQLDLMKDMMKQLLQANDETRREIKKIRKAEAVERALQETEKLKTLFLLQVLVNELSNLELNGETNANEHADLANAVQVVRKYQFVRLAELLNHGDSNMQETLDMLAMAWSQLLGGSKKVVDSEPGKERTTYRNIRDNLLALANSGFLTNKMRKEEEAPDGSVSSDSESIPPSPVLRPDQSENEALIRATEKFAPVAGQRAQMPVKGSQYSFMQDSQLDLESPHFDPAVVAVSSCLPRGSSINSQLDLHCRRATALALLTNADVSSSTELTSHRTLSPGGDVATNGSTGYDQFNDVSEWNNALASNQKSDGEKNGRENQGNGTNDERNDGKKGKDSRFGAGGSRGGRGNFRRGTPNGYRGGPPPRGGGGRFGFQNNRIGYFHSSEVDPKPRSGSGSSENKDFVRPKGDRDGNGGNYGSGFNKDRRGGGVNSAHTGVARGRPPRWNNKETSERGGFGGYRGGFRGNNRPVENENGGFGSF